jgi:hypothetical protein
VIVDHGIRPPVHRDIGAGQGYAIRWRAYESRRRDLMRRLS